MITIHEVRDQKSDRLRFESVSQEEAHRFATAVYRDERVIVDLVSYEYEPRDHR